MVSTDSLFQSLTERHSKAFVALQSPSCIRFGFTSVARRCWIANCWTSHQHRHLTLSIPNSDARAVVSPPALQRVLKTFGHRLPRGVVDSLRQPTHPPFWSASPASSNCSLLISHLIRFEESTPKGRVISLLERQTPSWH